MTREELRADILEITTLVVERVVDEMITESNRNLRRMLSEDIVAVSDRVGRMDRRFTKKLDSLTFELRETNTLLKTHIADPNARNRPISA